MSFLKYVKGLIPKSKSIYECSDSIQVPIDSKQLRKLELCTPSQQTDLNDERVAGILESHQLRPAFDLSKNHLTVAVKMGARGRKTTLYLMDGQHRVSATLNIDDFPFIVTFQNTPCDDDVRELFRQINMDSHKNKLFILLSKEDAKMSDDLYDHLKRTREVLFSDKGSARLRTLREFVDMLGNAYFSRFKNFEDMRDDFEGKNAAFVAGVKQFFEYCYADEKACCEAGFIAPLKESNFVDYLLLHGTSPYYVGKKCGGRAINAALKNAVWHAYFPTTLEGKCTCCRASTIGSRNFDCGHVISVNAGGKTTKENLRPVCGNCNSSMGKQNMDEFKAECGF